MAEPSPSAAGAARRPSSAPISFIRQPSVPLAAGFAAPPIPPRPSGIPVPRTSGGPIVFPAATPTPTPAPPAPVTAASAAAIQAHLFPDADPVAAASSSASGAPLFSQLPPYAEAKRLLDSGSRPEGAPAGGGSTAPPGGLAIYDTSSTVASPVLRPEGQPDRTETVQRINNALARLGPLVQLEERTGIPRLYLAVGLGVLVSLLTILIFGITFFTNALSFVYPAWRSYKALERDGNAPDVTEEQLHWLVYWVVYGIFHLLESIIDAMFSWLWAYTVIKLCFLIWCFMPQTKGAGFIYKKLLRPVFHHNEENIDHGLVKVNRAIAQVTRELREMSSELIGTVFGSLLRAMTSIRLPSEAAPAAGAGAADAGERKSS